MVRRKNIRRKRGGDLTAPRPRPINAMKMRKSMEVGVCKRSLRTTSEMGVNVAAILVVSYGRCKEV